MSEELTLLKERAAALGIAHSPNIGVEALKTKIAAKLEPEVVVTDSVVTDSDEDPVLDAQPAPTTKLSKAAWEAQERMKQHDEQMKLVRIRVTNLNPAKKDLLGEVFSVGNAYLGTVKKFIPYGEASDNGYHVPFILYSELKDRKFVSIKVRKVQGGQDYVEQRLVNEFAIEVLEPLTPAELSKLAAQQAAAAGLD